MSRRLIPTLALSALAALVALAAGCATTASPEVQTELDWVYADYVRAYMAQDLEAIGALIADDYEGTTVEGRPFDKQDLLDDIAARYAQGEILSCSMTVEGVQRIGTRRWVATVREEFRRVRDGIDVVEINRMRDIWTRTGRDERWLVQGTDVIEAIVRLADG